TPASPPVRSRITAPPTSGTPDVALGGTCAGEVGDADGSVAGALDAGAVGEGVPAPLEVLPELHAASAATAASTTPATSTARPTRTAPPAGSGVVAARAGPDVLAVRAGTGVMAVRAGSGAVAVGAGFGVVVV